MRRLLATLLCAIAIGASAAWVEFCYEFDGSGDVLFLVERRTLGSTNVVKFSVRFPEDADAWTNPVVIYRVGVTNR